MLELIKKMHFIEKKQLFVDDFNSGNIFATVFESTVPRFANLDQIGNP